MGGTRKVDASDAGAVGGTFDCHNGLADRIAPLIHGIDDPVSVQRSSGDGGGTAPVAVVVTDILQDAQTLGGYGSSGYRNASLGVVVNDIVTMDGADPDLSSCVDGAARNDNIHLRHFGILLVEMAANTRAIISVDITSAYSSDISTRDVNVGDTGLFSSSRPDTSTITIAFGVNRAATDVYSLRKAQPSGPDAGAFISSRLSGDIASVDANVLSTRQTACKNRLSFAASDTCTIAVSAYSEDVASVDGDVLAVAAVSTSDTCTAVDTLRLNDSTVYCDVLSVSATSASDTCATVTAFCHDSAAVDFDVARGARGYIRQHENRSDTCTATRVACVCSDAARVGRVFGLKHKFGLRAVLADRGTEQIAAKIGARACFGDELDGASLVLSNLDGGGAHADVRRDAGVDIEAVSQLNRDRLSLRGGNEHSYIFALPDKAVHSCLLDVDGGVPIGFRDIDGIARVRAPVSPGTLQP